MSLMRVTGLEPMTTKLKVLCSTIWATRAYNKHSFAAILIHYITPRHCKLVCVATPCSDAAFRASLIKITIPEMLIWYFTMCRLLQTGRNHAFISPHWLSHKFVYNNIYITLAAILMIKKFTNCYPCSLIPSYSTSGINGQECDKLKSWMAGLGPTTSRATIWCSTNWTTFNK